MSISVDLPLRNISVYVSMYNDIIGWYIADCIYHKPSYYNSFGWKYKQYGRMKIYNNIQSGYNYTSALFWAVSDSFDDIWSISSRLYAFEIISVNTNKIINISTSSTQHNFVNIMDKNNMNMTYYPGDTITLSVNASFNTPSNISLYVQQCINNNCQTIGTPIDFVYTQKMHYITFMLPLELQSEILVEGLSTYLYIQSDLCSESSITTNFTINIMPKYEKYIMER